MKPQQTLLFLIGVAFLCAVTMYFFPKDGIRITDDFKLTFTNFEDFKPDTTTEEKIEDIEEFLSVYEEPIDSTAIKDSLKQVEAARRKALLRIQWKEGKPTSLIPFFEALESGEPQDTSIRVMHYGDSQIEGDRITGFLRNEFQKEFGGYGPGLQPVVQTIPTSAIVQRSSENWHTYSLIGRPDSLVTHKRYGAMATFAQFEPILPDTARIDSLMPETTDSSKIQNAWVEFEPSRYTYNRAKRYTKLRMLYGNVKDTTTVSVYLEDTLFTTDTLKFNTNSAQSSWTFGKTPAKMKLVYEGKTSPEFYGFSLESETGVHTDNIAMRGSSGTIFRRIDARQLSEQYDKLNVKLILLQYGGNTVPYIKDSLKAENYGNWFRAQIEFLQRLNPDAGIVLIGPSDMATKVGRSFETYPFLETVRDELKRAAFETGVGFWDIYEVMGGKNSMQSWVEADPPLAGSDYVHFTGRGAKRIAELFHKALWQDFEAWKTSSKKSASDSIRNPPTSVPLDSATAKNDSVQ